MLRVLVMDDNNDTAESTRLLVALWGHDAQVARDGATALRAAEALRPDAVLLDLALGGRPDGYEVARQLRRQGGKQPLIVCISGYGRDDDRRKSREDGCDRHLTKPADPDESQNLLHAIQDGSAPSA